MWTRTNIRAQLRLRFGEHRIDGFGKTGQPVHGSKEDVQRSPVFNLVHNAHPEHGLKSDAPSFCSIHIRLFLTVFGKAILSPSGSITVYTKFVTGSKN
jgi:hypothetical protein